MKVLKYIFSLYVEAFESLYKQIHFWIELDRFQRMTDSEQIDYFFKDNPKGRFELEKKVSEMIAKRIKKDTLFVNGRLITIEM